MIVFDVYIWISSETNCRILMLRSILAKVGRVVGRVKQGLSTNGIGLRGWLP